MMRGAYLIALGLVLSLACSTAAARGLDPLPQRSSRMLLGANAYKQGDPVPLWASKVGPFSNPR
jgi:hypothetical protein